MTQTVTFKQSYRCKTESNFFVTFTIVAAILCGITFTANFSIVTAQEVGTPTETSKIWDDWEKIQYETDAGKLNRLVSEIKDCIAPPHEKSVPSIEIKCKVEPTLAIFSPDGKKIAITYIDNTIQMNNADSGKVMQIIDDMREATIGDLLFSSNGKKIITTRSPFRGDPFVEVIDTENGEIRTLIVSESSENLQEFMDFVSIPSHGTIVAVDKCNRINLYDVESIDNSVDIRPRESIQLPREESFFVEYVVVSPAENRIAVKHKDGTIGMWHATLGEELYRIEGAMCDLLQIAMPDLFFGIIHNVFSPDGDKFVTVEDSSIVQFRKVRTGEVLWTLPEGLSEKLYSNFSPDGKKIAVANNSNSVQIRNMDNGNVLQTLAGHDKYVTGILFSPNSKRIVTTGYDDTLKIWDVETGNQVGDTIGGYLNSVIAYEFSSDGNKIVICGFDNTVLILDAVTCKKLHVLRGHTSGVTSAMFSQDGKKVVTTSKDNTVRIWTLP